MSTNYRCTRASCRKRLSICKGQPIPACPACGGHLSHDPTLKRKTKLQTCRCDSIPFPHRRTTLGCSFGPALDEESYRTLVRNLHRPAHKRVNF